MRRSLCLFVLIAAPLTAFADPELAPIPTPTPVTVVSTPTLPGFFRPGNKIAFAWWQGTGVTRGYMWIDEVQNGWVRMHTPDNALRGWIYPPGMSAIWGE